MTSSSFQHLLDTAQLWRGRQADTTVRPGVSTRHGALDALLPGGGWPRGGLIEVLPNTPGIGELQLLLPTLASFCTAPASTSRTRRASQQTARSAPRIVLIDPPYLPYGPGLEQGGLKLEQLWWINPASTRDANWACEQSLRSGVCPAVLFWPRQAPDDKSLRRLQLAAEQGQSLAFLFRPPEAGEQASPAAIRMQVSRRAQGLHLELRKCRGLSGRPQVQLPWPG